MTTRPPSRITFKFYQLAVWMFLVLFFPFPAYPSVIRVTPVILIFDSNFKHGMVSVINEGDDPIQVEIKAVEWTQDGEGKDRYQDTKDIIFFPKILQVKPGQNRSIRAGVKNPAISREKTYRLFIKEMAKATPDVQGSQVRIALQFGVAVFVKPLKEIIKGTVEKIMMEGRNLRFDIRNMGNTHFRIESITVKGIGKDGKETFRETLNGWYLLADTTRTYKTTTAPEVCLKFEKIILEIKSDTLTINKEVNVRQSLCLP